MDLKIIFFIQSYYHSKGIHILLVFNTHTKKNTSYCPTFFLLFDSTSKERMQQDITTHQQSEQHVDDDMPFVMNIEQTFSLLQSGITTKENQIRCLNNSIQKTSKRLNIQGQKTMLKARSQEVRDIKTHVKLYKILSQGSPNSLTFVKIIQAYHYAECTAHKHKLLRLKEALKTQTTKLEEEKKRILAQQPTLKINHTTILLKFIALCIMIMMLVCIIMFFPNFIHSIHKTEPVNYYPRYPALNGPNLDIL